MCGGWLDGAQGGGVGKRGFDYLVGLGRGIVDSDEGGRL